MVTHEQFQQEIRSLIINKEDKLKHIQAVTGPGRSGAVAAVYASYILGVPFIPYGQVFPGHILVIDTVAQSGKTLRKAVAKLKKTHASVTALSVYKQQERLHFWYEQSI